MAISPMEKYTLGAMTFPEKQPDITVRLATIEEASAIAFVLHEAFVAYEALYTPEAFAATTPTDDQILQRWKEGPVWVAVDEGRIMGTVSAMQKGSALYVRSMAVLPDAGGRGIGRILLENVELSARAGSFQRMFLSTTPFLDKAIRLYEKFGFERTEEGPHALWGTPLFTMEKVLPPIGG